MLKCWDIILLSVDERQCWFIDYKRSGANGCYIRLVLVDPGLQTPSCGVLGSWAHMRDKRITLKFKAVIE